HVIGKNVWKFHAVYWPALLLSARLPLPSRIVVHGFLTENGRKISKSRGGSLNPIDLIHEFGVDAVRYALLRGVSSSEDGDFSLDRLKALHDTDLANGLGNLARRLTTLAQRCGELSPDLPRRPPPPRGFAEALEAHALDSALSALLEIVSGLNREIDRERPWESPRTAARCVSEWIQRFHGAVYWLGSFLPRGSARLLKGLEACPIRACEVTFPRLS
ncbi:MAG: class I tRNA ligase family protein, partial [Planctomycetota bacterium]